MASLVLDIPDSATADEVRLLVAIRLFQEGRASSGYAAAVAGLDRPAFWDELGRRGIPLIDYEAGELERDLPIASGARGE